MINNLLNHSYLLLACLFGMIVTSLFLYAQDTVQSHSTLTVASKAVPTIPITIQSPTYSISNLKTYIDTYEHEQKLLTTPKTPVVLGASTQQTRKITIALFGDSLVDTMETQAPYLNKAIRKTYPYIDASILNYGVGSQTIQTGSKRFHDSLEYKDRSYPPILQSHADVFIIESFAYNPESYDQVEAYQASLRSILEEVQQQGKPVFFLASLAPLREAFGKGPNGVNWPEDQAIEHAKLIQYYLNAGIQIAKSLSIPIIDVYHATTTTSGGGTAIYVSKDDGIHPSVEGHRFTAQMIVSVLHRQGVF